MLTASNAIDQQNPVVQPRYDVKYFKGVSSLSSGNSDAGSLFLSR